MHLHPLHPAAWVLDRLCAGGWQPLDLLAFTRASTLVLATRGGPEPVVIKAGFGSNHVLAELDEDMRPAAYGFYWYQEMTEAERALARDDFVTEIETARAATGVPYVAPVVGHGDLGGLPWYAMPYYGRGSLRRLASMAVSGRAPAAVIRCVAALADAATGLDNLHRLGIVHRDVYQENILLTDDHAVVTDLGAARRSGDDRGPERRGPEVHWPPEYAGSYRTAGPAADVFSLAVLVHRVLCGDIPRLHGIGRLAGAPPHLRPLLSAALAPDPVDRPPMPDFARALRRSAAALAGAR